MTIPPTSKSADQPDKSGLATKRAAGPETIAASNALTLESVLFRQPYPGMRSFRQDEAALFFGREIEVRHLRDILAERNLVVVLGGSGSGKSSLVRAGLLPKLNSTAPIPKRSGAWYIVEFRPRTNPAEEIFEAIYQQIFLPLIAPPRNPRAKQGSESVERGSEAADCERRLQAVSAALNVDPPLEASEDTEARCKGKLRKALFTNDEFDVGGLFEFADETIVTLDEKLAGAPRSGRANLLLLIDQFEEVFSLPPQSKRGVNLIMSLVTSIQTYRPFNLFLIVTMRNEWLHRCAEFPGVAEAMNGSTYLIDLLAGPDIEKVIVEPARWVLQVLGLAVGNASTGPFAPEALRRLRDAFDDQTMVAHAPDQLPLLQHLLPLVWDEAVRDWTKNSGNSPVSVEVRHIEAVLGWKSPDPLSACLNAHANQVMAKAIAATLEAAPELQARDCEQLLRVAFSNLAVLDDQGIVRRRFATIDEILSTAGIVERHPDAREKLRAALLAALTEFQSATLIDRHTMIGGDLFDINGDLFDINHEALVRNWATYTRWVKRARDLQDRLIALDRKAQSSSTRGVDGFRNRCADLIQDFFTAAKLRSAAEDVGTETSQELIRDVFGSDATFSHDWMRLALEKNGDASDLDIDQRGTAVREKVYAAERFRNNIINRYRALAVLGGTIGVAVFFLAVIHRMYLHDKSLLERETDTVLWLQRLSRDDSTSWQSSGGDIGVAAAKSYAAYRIGLRILEQETYRSPLRSAVAEVVADAERTMRSQLSGALWLRSGRMATHRNSGGGAKISEIEARCVHVVDPREKKEVPVSLYARAEIIWAPNEDGKWSPRWKNPDKHKKLGTPQPEDLPPGSVFCTSPDGFWQLVWVATLGNSQLAGSQPVVRNIAWNQLRGKAKYQIEVERPRSFRDEKSLLAYHPETRDSEQPNLYAHFGQISKAVLEHNGSTNKAVKFVQDGPWVGFSILLDSEKKVFLWTISGLTEPEEVESLPGNVAAAMRPCKPREQINCDLGQMTIGKFSYRVLLSWWPPAADINCERDPCPVSIGVQFSEPALQSVLRTRLQKPNSTLIKKGTADDGYLWLRDDFGQAWRYSLDPTHLLEVHADAFGALYPERLGAESCRKLDCLKELPARK